MRQLGELKENAEKFEEAGLEIIAIFREEREGVEGLKKIKEKTGVDFTLCLDTGAEKTSAYSPGRGKFDNYLIGSDGKVAAIFDGSLTKRALSEQLLEAIEKLDSDSEDD